MKSIVSLLAILMMALSLLPCMDSGCQDEHEYSTCIEAPCTELCPPFCQCDCCGSQGWNEVPYFKAASVVFGWMPLLHVQPGTGFESGVIARIWQPPKRA